MTARSRRWSFSLRTLMIVIALVACWLVYYQNWKSQRQIARAWMQAQGFEGPMGGFGGIQSNPSALPWGLRVLGEEPLHLFLMKYEPAAKNFSSPSEEYQSLVERIRRLFPEAAVLDVTAPSKRLKASDGDHN